MTWGFVEGEEGAAAYLPGCRERLGAGADGGPPRGSGRSLASASGVTHYGGGGTSRGATTSGTSG